MMFKILSLDRLCFLLLNKAVFLDYTSIYPSYRMRKYTWDCRKMLCSQFTEDFLRGNQNDWIFSHFRTYMKTRDHLWYANAVKTVFYGWLLIMPHQIRHLILGCNPNSYAMAFFWKWLNIQSYSFAPELEWKSAHRKKKCKFFILESHRIGLRIIRQKETWSRALFHKLLLLEHLKWLKSMIISE